MFRAIGVNLVCWVFSDVLDVVESIILGVLSAGFLIFNRVIGTG